MRPRFSLCAIAAAVLLTGCATQTPEWISAPPGIHCAAELNRKCLESLSQARYEQSLNKAYLAYAAEVANKVEVASAPPAETETEPAGELGQIAVIEDGAEIVAVTSVSLPSEPALVLGSIPKLAFGMASFGITPKSNPEQAQTEELKTAIESGKVLHAGVENPKQTLQQLLASKDKARAAESIYYLLATQSSLAERDNAAALNLLHDFEPQLYRLALLNRLPELLNKGDFERAAALGETLIRDGSVDGEFSYPALVAVAYTLAGFPGDGKSVVESAVLNGASISPDDLELIKVATLINNGVKISPYDFDGFQRKEARAAAYQVIAIAALQLGSNEAAKEVLWLGLRQAQKSNAGVNKDRVLGELLVLLNPLL